MELIVASFFLFIFYLFIYFFNFYLCVLGKTSPIVVIGTIILSNLNRKKAIEFSGDTILLWFYGIVVLSEVVVFHQGEDNIVQGHLEVILEVALHQKVPS